jgi:hypothetical protein
VCRFLMFALARHPITSANNLWRFGASIDRLGITSTKRHSSISQAKLDISNTPYLIFLCVITRFNRPLLSLKIMHILEYLSPLPKYDRQMSDFDNQCCFVCPSCSLEVSCLVCSLTCLTAPPYPFALASMLVGNALSSWRGKLFDKQF